MNNSDQKSDNRKRKFATEEENNKTLNLSINLIPLSVPSPPTPPPPENVVSRPPTISRPDSGGSRVSQNQPLPGQLPQLHEQIVQPVFRSEVGSSRSRRVSSNQSRTPYSRRNTRRRIEETRDTTIPPPFPWATNQRATVHSLRELQARNIAVITGDVECKQCRRRDVIELNLMEKYNEIGQFIARNKAEMYARAPENWTNPVLPRCNFCLSENSMKPIISEDKDGINWLFLVLGQMLGCCTLEHLRYFCEHNKLHRTASKDRLLYMTYFKVCKQLDPDEMLFYW